MDLLEVNKTLICHFLEVIAATLGFMFHCHMTAVVIALAQHMLTFFYMRNELDYSLSS